MSHKHVIKSYFFTAAVLVIGTATGHASPPEPKVTICHKYDTPAENTLTIGYRAALSHVREHNDFLGACPAFDDIIDADGIATPDRGIPEAVNVRVGDPLVSWPTGFYIEGLDWFDNDGTCTWTFGDDLHLEDPQGTCKTAIRQGLHDEGADCAILDLDGSFFTGQQVDVDLESGTTFTGCPGADPLLKFYDSNGNGFYDNGEDIVLDKNSNGIFD